MLQDKTQLYFFFIVLGVVILLTYYIFLPFIIVMAISATLAVLVYPMYRKFCHWYKGKEGLAAISTIVVLLLILVLPLILISFSLLNEAGSLYRSISSGNISFQNFFDDAETKIRTVVPSFNLDLQEYSKQLYQWVTTHVAEIFSGTLDITFKLFISLIALYYFLKDGEKFKEHIALFTPLQEKYDQMIFDTLAKTIRSVVLGSLIVALIQGVLSGIGMAIFGVPNPVLWGTIAGIAALIPGIGTALVLVPATIFLFFFGGGLAWIGLLVWAVLAVGLIDNFLGPKLIERGVHIHPLLILFSVIGGVVFFGPVGFILGPLVLSLLFALLKIYEEIAGVPNDQKI